MALQRSPTYSTHCYQLFQQPKPVAFKPQTPVRHLAGQHRGDVCVCSSYSEPAEPEHAAQQPLVPVPIVQPPQVPQQAATPPQAAAPPQQQMPAQQAQQPAPQQPKSPQQKVVVAPQPPIGAKQPQKQQPVHQTAPKQQARPKQTLQQAVQQRFGWLQGVLANLKLIPASLVAFLIGGCFVCSLLWGWAKGSPIRKHNPYTFTMTFTEASKLARGTPVRMKGVQIGQINKVTLQSSHLEAIAEVCDAANVVPRGSRVDINLLGLASDPWIDITPPAGCLVRKDHGPHHPECAKDGLIVCNGGEIKGHQGGSTDFMMKFFLSQHDRAHEKTVDVIYHNKRSQS